MVCCNAWRPENLFEEENGNGKVGVGDHFLSKFEILEIMTFWLLMTFLDGFRALNCSRVFAGANFKIAKIDVSLELKIHVSSRETLGNDHLGL